MRVPIEQKIARLVERGRRFQARGDALIKQAAHLDMIRQERRKAREK